MFGSIIDLTSSDLTLKLIVLCTMTSILAGFAISYIYMYTGKYTKNFSIALVILPVLIQVVIMLVNGNLGTSVAVLGAFSLVRFRSVPGSSKEICSIFFAMAIGLATGMGYLTFALLATVIVGLIFVILYKTSFGEVKQDEKELRITIPENLDYTEIFDDLFETYTSEYTLDKVKTTNLGSMYELHYHIILKDQTKEKNFIDDLRCRNGNLTIICSRVSSRKEEL
ncbi:DUF4956 domain-containing protein [Niameybacter massiliensis]|uniref:DUF4956 domain-containing protein n=1 Tax=Holtiella tumoricola TaxID=3018743 RepID=A0AA42J0D4_9FIRM|nr:DUF4956 domain-containing protein [Holtiella tumoricola]MDA3731164.1 DUF4956 domain-containing protein [Holtiella tumoricola]